MRALLLSFILISTSAFAGLRHLGVKNLSLEYTAPRGIGSVEKIDIGLSKSGTHLVEVDRIGDTFVVTTPMLNFSWLEPWRFLLDAEKISLLSATLDARKTSLDVSIADAKVLMNGEYALRNGVVHCEGQSSLPDLERAFLEICRDKLTAEAERFEVPIDIPLTDILSRLPPQPEEEQPLKNFTLTIKDGEFYMYFLAQVVVKAGLRAWGSVHYEEDLKFLVIRVDLIKFGYFPVTSIVMKELRDRIKDPRVKIDPPFIRYQMRD